MRALSPSDLDAIPRLGWVREATPVTSLDRLAGEVGLAWLGVKRDDLCEPLYGGTKPRKLDYVLAEAPFADAEGWASSGGIGSGSLVALTAAAQKLERRLRAHVFWTPLSAGITDNLAFTATGPTRLVYHRSRTTLALTSPSVVLGGRDAGLPVVPPGATSPRGIVGTIRAGLELAAQIAAGDIPEPQRVYVALGSGGTAAGLAIGLALGGIRGTKVVAVGVVERLLSPEARVHSLARAAIAELVRFDLPAPEGPLPLAFDRGHLGAAYAHPTPASIAAVEAIAAHGITLEPVYSGKAMAALLADARRGGVERALLWCTVRRALPEPDPAWRDKLPPALRRRLETAPGRITRRHVLLGAAAAAAVAFAVRTTGYDDYPGFPGTVLSSWHARVLHAAAEALIPDATPEQVDALPAAIDRYLAGMPAKVKREVKAMLALIEHGTTPIGGRVHRFTLLSPQQREAFLAGLEQRGGVFSQAYRGLRDLVMLGYYQQPSTWPMLGYGGPKIPADRARMASYDALRAPEGELPKGVLR